MTLVPFQPRSAAGYREPHRVHDRLRSTVVTWVLVVAAMGADLAALYSVLQLLFRSQNLVIAVGVVGLLAAAVLLAHHAGVATAQLRAADPRASRRMRDLMVAGWLALGLATCATRVFLPTGSTAGFGQVVASGPHMRDVLAAALFLAVHVATGLAVMHHARTRHNPYVTALRHARAEHRAAERAEAAARAHLVRARSVLDQQRGEREREDARWRIARAGVRADVAELQELARVLIAVGVQEAPATDALTRPDDRPVLDGPSL